MLTARGNPRSEAGAIGVGALVGVALLAFVAYLLLGAAEGDPDHFGAVPVPGSATVELPKGQTDVYYAEGIEPDSSVVLEAPDDLAYSITTADGQAVSVNSRGGEPEETESGMARVIGAVYAPADGIYTVEVDSPSAAQRIRPAITFGQSPFEAVEARFDDVVDGLAGPVGIVIAAILVVLFLLPRFRRTPSRRG